MTQMTLKITKAAFRKAAFVVFALAFGVISTGVAQDKKIALTFDSLPALKPVGYWTPREISNMILRAMAPRKIVAAGFVVAEKIEDDPTSVIVLEDWLSRGHLIGNQTFGNVDLNELNEDDFLQHAADGERPIKIVSQRFRANYHFFRFPQLHEGNTAGKKKGIRRALYNADYVVVPVTVKTSDFRFNRPLLARQRSKESLDPLKAAYLQHISKMLDYAEKQSQALFDRNIPQILWLHAGIATAFFMDDLLTLLQSRGYSFVSVPEALADPAYKTEEKYVGPLGLSFLDRVAATRGFPYDEKYGDITDPETEKLLTVEDEER
jgi:peptidoglycan/xylan/chitin deacetylase (PgdA/CDA1 family)